MSLRSLREAASIPGLRSLLLVTTVARIPATAVSMTMTFHVVTDLNRGYGAAGTVIAAVTLGIAFGAPLLGRLIDRRGLRVALMVTAVAQAVYWAVAPTLSYPSLLIAAVVGGATAVPVPSITRQCVAALAPPDRRRQVYSLESICTEISFMVGPPVAVMLSATFSPRLTMYIIGSGVVLAALALLALNPPIRGDHEESTAGGHVPIRRWLTFELIVALACTAAATLVLGGTDVVIVATMREAGQSSQLWIVLAAWCVYSAIGGLISGATKASPPIPALLAGMSVATMPVGLATGAWWQLAAALVPAGLLCAPTMSAAADEVIRQAPAAVRGTVTGLYGSFITTGLAMGAPLAGVVTDAASPAWGSVAIGLAGLAVAALRIGGSASSRWSRRPRRR